MSNFNYMTSNIHLIKSTILAWRATAGRKEAKRKDWASLPRDKACLRPEAQHPSSATFLASLPGCRASTVSLVSPGMGDAI